MHRNYDPEVAKAICKHVAHLKSSREIAAMEGMPSRATIFQWLATNPDFADQYARAKAAIYHAWEEDIVEISDDGTNDWMERQRETKGVRIVENAEAINRSRLRVDSRKWLLSKLLPKKYGDKIVQEVGITNEFGEFLKRVAEQGRSIHGSEEKG